MPTVVLDGISVQVETGATILDAARKAGVWIPTLCYHPSVSPPAACRLCMVELDRGDWKQLVTSCNYPVRRDLVVSVSSDAAVKARRGVMELLLARAPDNAQLKALARRMGVEGTPYPTVSTTQRDCILCGLCTAVCEEVIGRAAIGFAGRGMDRAVALLAAREGASVAVNSLNPAHAKAVAEEARSYGAAAIDVVGDVSRSEDVDRAVKETVSRFGRIDILVNNAGISRTTSPLETISDDDWYEVMDVNLKGVFNSMRAVLPDMKRQKGGKIVNISSSAGRNVSTHAGAHYTASKAGVLGLTRHAAREAAAFNINVNAVTPDTIDTPMMREHMLREYGEKAEEHIRRRGSPNPSWPRGNGGELMI